MDGSLYMGRWRVVDEIKQVPSRIDLDTCTAYHERTLGSRILEKLTGYRSVRLHHINRPDHDRDLHNHPFEYRTFICNGWYSEVYANAPSREEWDYRFLFKGDSGVGSNTKWHRIDWVSAGGVWTLFCMTENTEEWGFDTPDGYVESREYFRRRGYD